MGVEAVVMTEMPVMMPVMMMASHPGMGVEYARVHMHDPDLRGMCGPARSVGHRGRHHKHGSR